MEEIKEIAKTYDPKQVEDRLYKNWMEKGYFKGTVDKSKKPFTIVIPPPNITGQLHMGHALNNTIQDILIRHKRMQGFAALWVPGTDHASIATEAKIVEAMAKEGISKDDLGRDKFLERAWEWKKLYGGKIVEQLKKLGSSCDWSRERFTLDEGLSDAVMKVFVDLYEKGLIYRGERIINWCPKCLTSISDAEVDFEEKEGNMWHIRYPVYGGDGYVVVATTRPETMLGDTAVAVNPKDERYKHLIGKMLRLPLANREIPVIADEYVEMDFGTGAVKITPAHDPNDFEMGVRHNLPIIKVMDDNANMNQLSGKYVGLERYEARKKIVGDLEELGLIELIKPHTHNVGNCYRCTTIIEPSIKLQWFVKMKPLAEPALDVVRDGTVKFIPERFSKTYFNWMENIRDWCISRQLWWGHRIPAYYCQACNHTMVSKDEPKSCEKCGASSFVQDPDTLDTWFSSALWPFSTLGWPNKTDELEFFYPTNVLVTAYDIIFHWVARMIFSGIEHLNKEPFPHVLMHGLVRDSQGRKMSKSLGNGIDPLEVIEKYGTDALRFALTIGTTAGNDIRFSLEKIESSRNFANKIWNASRFVLMNFEEAPDFSKVDEAKYTTADKWILSKLNKLTQEVSENMEKYEIGIALQKLYEFIWEEFCDWYIELVKGRLYDKEDPTRLEALYVLNYVLGSSMKLLHPYMPFITEEIYSHLYNQDESIMISKWPVYMKEHAFIEDEVGMEAIMTAVRTIRNIRAEMNVPPSKKANIYIVTGREDLIRVFAEAGKYFERLASAQGLIVQNNKDGIGNDMASGVMDGAEIFIPLSELIDISKELERLQKERDNLETEIERAVKKLSNKGFVDKAPASVIEEEKAKELKYREMQAKIIERIKLLPKS